MRNKKVQQVALSGLLTSLMLVFGFIERQFPLPVPVPGIERCLRLFDLRRK